MKTLDEVIEALARDEYYCIECPLQYSCDGAEGGCYLSEAARYLHEYQWHMTNPDGDHLQLEKCRALLQDFYRNVPLTWDELKTMEGKPVWVEILEATDSDFVQYRWGNGAWYIVKDFVLGALAEYCQLTPNRRTWTKQSYGEEWQAYRKERSS